MGVRIASDWGGIPGDVDQTEPPSPAWGGIDGPTAERFDCDLHERLVRDELRRLRARHEARERFRAEISPALPPIDVATLDEILARPADPAARVEGLIPWAAGTLIVAKRKVGKTHILGNLAASLLTGARFLGAFEVRPVTGSIAFLNFEVSGQQLGGWLAAMDVPRDRLVQVNLRGRVNPFRNSEDLRSLGTLLRAHQVESVIVDPFTRAFTGDNQNDAGQVSAWLATLDEFVRSDVGALDVILTAHAGWMGDHSRGSSELEGWPDSILTLTQDESVGTRFLSAFGRDVSLDEDRLDFDPQTRLLTLSGAGGRKDAARAARLGGITEAILDIVTDQPGATGYAIAQALRAADVPHQNGDHTKALAAALEAGLLTTEAGKRNAKRYFMASPTPTYPDLSRRATSPTYPHLPIGGGVCGAGLEQAPPTPTCRTCGKVLHESVIADGFDTHPTCGSAGESPEVRRQASMAATAADPHHGSAAGASPLVEAVAP